MEKENFKKKSERGAIHWRAGANQPAQPAKPARTSSRPRLPPPPTRARVGRARPTALGPRRCVDGMRDLAGATTSPPPVDAPAHSPFSPLTVSLASLPSLYSRPHHRRHWSFRAHSRPFFPDERAILRFLLPRAPLLHHRRQTHLLAP